MTLHINDSSTWREVTGVYVNDGGTWRTIQEVHVNDGGTWRKVYSAAAPTNFGGIYERDRVFTSPATATVTFQTDGSIQGSGTGTVAIDTITTSGAGDTWYSPTTVGIGSSYWVRATKTAGTNPSTGTLGSWLQLNAARAWSNSMSTGGSKTSTLTIEIASDSSGTTIVCSGSVEIIAVYEP